MELTAAELARATGGRVEGDPAARATSFAIDTRLLEAGGCFCALVAARDGHAFVDDAWARGAAVVMVARVVGSVPSGCAAVVVDSPLRALGAVAAETRRRLSAPIVVGITGSAGKTTTKDLTAAALATTKNTVESRGSFNNEAGVPLTLLRATTDAEAVVLEMGARAEGDIRSLCDIARPTVGVITNIGLAHVGRFGDAAGVARAKGELVEALDADGLAVLRAEDDLAYGLAARTSAPPVLVAVDEGAPSDPWFRASVRADRVMLDDGLRPTFRLETPWGGGTIRLELRGAHHVANAALAAVVALAHGAPFDAVSAALGRVEAAPWRMQVMQGPDDIVVLNDAYNANPGSTSSALHALARLPNVQRRIAVLGDMRELGAHSAAEHARIGALAAELGIDVVIAVGGEIAPLAAAARHGVPDVVVVADATAARAALATLITPRAAVLVKGSRAVGLEQLAQDLVADDAAGQGVERVP